MKKIFIISLTLAMAFAPISVLAEPASDGIEVSVSGITLSINGGNVTISGANGEVMEIFNLTGVKVSTIRIDSNDKAFAKVSAMMNIFFISYIIRCKDRPFL